MKLLFRLSGILLLLSLFGSASVRGANSYYNYTIGKAGNRARIAQMQRNEVLRRQQQQLDQQQKAKAQQEQAAKSSQNTAPVPNPPAQNNAFSNPRPYYAYRAIMPTNAPAKVKVMSESAESRAMPVSEFSGSAYDDAAPSLIYQREQAQKGNPESQYAMGLRYLDGNGVMQSDALAREWFAKSSSNGNLRARAKLRELSNEK